MTIKITSKKGNESIRECCITGDAKLLSSLLAGGAVITEQENPGANALYIAAEHGNLDCLKIVIRAGGSVNNPTYSKNLSATPLHVAAYGGHLDCILELIRAGAILDFQDAEGGSALHDAAASESNRSPFCIHALVSAGANVNLSDGDGRTPLYWASYSGNMENVKALVALGADISIRTKSGGSPEEDVSIPEIKGYLCSLREQVLLQQEALYSFKYLSGNRRNTRI